MDGFSSYYVFVNIYSTVDLACIYRYNMYISGQWRIPRLLYQFLSASFCFQPFYPGSSVVCLIVFNTSSGYWCLSVIKNLKLNTCSTSWVFYRQVPWQKRASSFTVESSWEVSSLGRGTFVGWGLCFSSWKSGISLYSVHCMQIGRKIVIISWIQNEESEYHMFLVRYLVCLIGWAAN